MRNEFNTFKCVFQNYNQSIKKTSIMKNYILPFIILLFISVASFTSCKKDDNSPSPSSTSVLNSTIQQGNWRITNLNDSGNDETSDFSGYAIQFNSNGTIIATKSGSTINGTWNSVIDDSKLKLVLLFSAIPFDHLNDDWHVIQQNSSIIKLEDVSGGGSGTDYLTFEKL
jgi:hypothetical protein